MDEFSIEAISNINHYVYALVDPTIKETDPARFFYFGKGVGNRCFEHARGEKVREDLSDHELKLLRIRKIRKLIGRDPDVIIVAHGLLEEDAFRIEAILIDLIPDTTNATRGHRSENYWLPAKLANARHENPLFENDMEGVILFVSLNGAPGLPPYPEITADDLPRRTLGNWAILPEKATNIDYVAGCYQGLIKCVFKVSKHKGLQIHQPTKKYAKRRVQFFGERDHSKVQWEERRVLRRDGSSLTTFGRQQTCALLDTGRITAHRTG